MDTIMTLNQAACMVTIMIDDTFDITTCPIFVHSVTSFRFWFHTNLVQVKLRVGQLSKCHIKFGMHPYFNPAIRRPYHFRYHGLSAVSAFHSITLQAFCEFRKILDSASTKKLYVERIGTTIIPI